MIRIRGKGVSYGEIWFDEEPDLPGPDILVCRQRPTPWPGARCSDFYTLMVDLSKTEDALLAQVKKDTQYEIRRAAKEGAVFTFLDDPGTALGEFCAFYDRFAASSGRGSVSRAWLEAATAERRLALSCAATDAEPLVWHAYYVSDGRARLLHSASLFREQNKGARALVGRLNRWLHWQDILEFRRRGFRHYDLGGVFEDEASPSARGINRFKEEFGGEKRRDHECVAALTWKGRVYLAVQGLRNRARDARKRAPNP